VAKIYRRQRSEHFWYDGRKRNSDSRKRKRSS